MNDPVSAPEATRLEAAGLEAAGLEAAGLEAAGLEAAGLGMVDGVALLVLAVCVGTWLRWFIRYRGNAVRLLADWGRPETRPCPFWTPVEAMLMYGGMMVVSGLLVAAGLQLGVARIDPEDGRIVSDFPTFLPTVQAMTGPLVMALLIAVLVGQRDHAVERLGLLPRRGDLRLGLIAALLILPLVLLISTLANYVVAYEHPVLDAVTAGLNPLELSLLVFGTAIVAPVVEEFTFRVLLQGGLERWFSLGMGRSAMPTGESDDSTGWTPPAVLPIVITSVLFAAVHIGQGAGWVPLFFLSLGLGVLYRRTGRLAAPVVVHTVLNSLTLILSIVGSR